MTAFLNRILWFLSPRVRSIVIGALYTIGGLFCAALLISFLFVISQFNGNAEFPVDCAVVFGSAVHRGGEPGPGIQRRVEEAAELWKEGSIRRLFFTGGTGEGNNMSEARVMRNEALRLGVEPEIITLEEGATSTWQNIKFVEPFVQDCSSVVGISDRYHLARIRLAAWMLGLDMKVHPAVQNATPLFEIESILRESLGNVFYILQAPL